MKSVKTPPKPIRIASTTGHVVILPESTTTQIPDEIVPEALMRGCVLVGQDKDYDPDPEAQQPVYGKEAQDRKKLNEIKAVIEKMISEYKPNEWTKDGRPDAKSISRRRGKATKGVDRDKVWSENFDNDASASTG